MTTTEQWLTPSRAHLVTLGQHSFLLSATAFASFRVTTNLCRSFLFQFVRGGPSNLLKPRTSEYSASCSMRHMRWWSGPITWPSQCSLFSQSMFSILCCPVLALTSSLVSPFFHPRNSHKQLLTQWQFGLSGDALILINIGAVCGARLVLGWVTAYGYTILVFNPVVQVNSAWPSLCGQA